MVFVPDVGVVDPQSVYTFSLEACCQLIDDEILPGFLGGVDPLLTGPVVIIAQNILFEALVVGTIGGDRSDTQIGVDLAAAGFELLDLSCSVVLSIDYDRFVVLDLGNISVKCDSDEDTPGCCGGRLGRYSGRPGNEAKAGYCDCCRQEKRCETLNDGGFE